MSPGKSKRSSSKWMSDPSLFRYQDPEPGFDLSVEAQAHYKKHYGVNAPKVKPASLTSIQECMSLAGADYLTIGPHLLQKLHETPTGLDTGTEYSSVFDKEPVVGERLSFKNGEEFRIAMTRSGRGLNERKLSEAINVFCDFQEKLEDFMRKAGA